MLPFVNSMMATFFAVSLSSALPFASLAGDQYKLADAKSNGSATNEIDRFFEESIEARHRGDVKLEMKLLNRILEIDPSNVDALNNRCWAYATQNLADLAVPDCEKALAISPDYIIAFDSLALAHLVQRKFSTAISEYDMVLKLERGLPYAWYGRGIAKKRTGDEDGAKSDIAEAQRLMPNIQKIMSGYGILP